MKLAQTGALLGGRAYRRPTNTAAYETGLRNQLFADETRAWALEVGELATDCYDTAAQGIDLDDWYKYVPIRIRVWGAAQTATGESMLDDWRNIKIIAPTYVAGIGQGAMMEFASNVWIVYKPRNVSAIFGDAVIRRCNAVVNSLDYYGNIIATPMSFARMGTQGNAPQVTENMILSKNYVSCICQLNDVSAKFTENTRFILGDAAYAMRGVNKFTRESTMDPDSVHLMTFTAERQEPLEQDNLDNQVADWYSFSWVLHTTARRSVGIGETQTLAVQSIRNGVEVESTEQNPISYLFESSDETVATVSEAGVVTPVAEGSAVITVKLAQNPSISETVAISVSETGEDSVAFTSTLPEKIPAYDDAVISAAAYSGGTATEDEVDFTFVGAAPSTYKAEKTGRNTWTITCYGGSVIPLTVIISANGKTASTTIYLTY